eukprot:TRINITY_DN4237_c0_g1_i2.p1 TRINITY_DN4237_c0_g1~~TRINITY_DN4237_c0_g1_i2.p1  ORF type:complete len:263 (+),score=101.47 TRINITY_DN4237_c0_g1_i2:326-1114(+)
MVLYSIHEQCWKEIPVHVWFIYCSLLACISVESGERACAQRGWLAARVQRACFACLPFFTLYERCGELTRAGADAVQVMVGDGQVSRGDTVVKPNARKVRRLKENIVAGFAGATADALTLFERLEAKLDEHSGQLLRSCVEMAKAWRTDKYLRNLEAIMIVADKDISLTLTGNGDVIEPFDDVLAVGSGGDYALAAARALVDTELDAGEVALRAMGIAADLCVYTNHNFVTEVIEYDPEEAEQQLKDKAEAARLAAEHIKKI